MSAITQFGQSIALTLKQGIGDITALARDLSSVAREIAKDIKNIFHRTDNHVPSLNFNFSASKAGAGSAAKDLASLKLSGHELLKDKVKGVEPGFVSRKEWNTKDHEKPVRESGHPFNIRAKEWLGEQLSGKTHRKSAENFFTLGVEKLKQNTESVSKLDEHSRAQLDEIGTNGPLHGTFESFTPELKNAVFQEALTSLSEKEFSKLDQGIKNTIRADNQDFAQEIHTRLPDVKPGSLLAKYVIHKAKATGNIADFSNMIQKLDEGTRKATTLEAGHQKLVNSLTERLGMNTQKLENHYIGDLHTGTALLQSTQPKDFTDFSGKDGAAEGRVYIKDGVLVQNTPNKDNPTVFDGPPKLHKGIVELGRNKIKMLLLGDRDPLSNKGFVKNEGKTQFFSNESRYVLRKELQSKKVDVNSDFSFNAASQHKLMDNKNFGIFDQSTMAEKMEGVRQIQNLKTSRTDVTGLPDGLRKLYIARRDEILNTFENRLSVDKFTFADPNKASVSRDQTLNLLDGLEKLTSKTVGTADGKKNGIRLDIPQVQKPEDRKAWNVQQSGDQVQFTFQGKSSEAANILKTLENYSTERNEGLNAGYTFRRGPDDFITVSVNVANLEKAQSAMSYGNIMDYKHPSTES